MFQRRYADNRQGGGNGVTPTPTGIVSNPVLDPALVGQNLSLTPAVVTSPPPAPGSSYTLYINSAPVVGYIGVTLTALQSYVWQSSDLGLDAYVDETISSPWIYGSPVTVSSNTETVESAPINVTPSSIGTLNLVGLSPTVTPGVWTGSTPITYTYTLVIGGVPVPSYIGVSLATVNGYTYTAGDDGLPVYVDEIATNAFGTDTVPTNTDTVVTPVVTGTPVLADALEGDNLSLTPASVTPSAIPQTFTLYINSSAVVGYTGVSLAVLQSYVWQAADEWLDAYVEQDIPLLSLTLTSNVVNVDGLSNFILLVQTDAGTWSRPAPLTGATNPATNTDQFLFYANLGSTYDINWGDGTIQNGVTGTQTRTYASAGTYRVKTRNWSGATIAQSPPGIFAGTSDMVKLLELQQWGTTAWTTCQNMFANAGRMVGTYSDAPNLTAATTMQGMFGICPSFDGSPNASMGSWNVSNIQNMTQTFLWCMSFDQDIGPWDVSSVTNMTGLFQGSILFNQNITGWDVSSVTNMGNLFQAAAAFNQPIGVWDVSSVGSMSSMFSSVGLTVNSFNQDISAWNVSGVTAMQSMFRVINAGGVVSFDQDLGSWVLNNSVNLANMFDDSSMSTENYSRTLIGWANEWSATGDPTSRNLGAVGMTYHNTVYGGAPYSDAVSARAALVGATPGGAGWTITGDALVP